MIAACSPHAQSVTDRLDPDWYRRLVEAENYSMAHVSGPDTLSLYAIRHVA